MSRATPPSAGTARLAEALRLELRDPGIAVLVSVFPFYWMFVVASNSNAVMSQFPPRVIPGPNFIENARLAFEGVPFVAALTNSFIVASVITVSVLFFSTMAGFAFAKMRFRGRTALFTFVLGDDARPAAAGAHPAVHPDGQLRMGR
jgi:cellobiose transport system permease protein